MSRTVQMGNYTSYPSAFLVVDSDGVYSKYYYAGAQRIAARIGEESADRLFPEDSAGFCSRTTTTITPIRRNEVKEEIKASHLDNFKQ